MNNNNNNKSSIEREESYKHFPISKTCFYCNVPIDRWNSQRVMRIKDGPNGQDIYILEDICLKCLPAVRANVLSKKGGASIIDHNTKTVVSTNPNHVKEMIEGESKSKGE